MARTLRLDHGALKRRVEAADPGLTLFLRVPGAPLDNNVSERALKKVVLHRKNSLFYRTQKGAKTGDLYMSLPWNYREAVRGTSVRGPTQAHGGFQALADTA